MEFSRLTLDCIARLRPFFEDNQCRICDCTIGGTFMWRDHHRTEYAIVDEVLYLKTNYPEIGFAPPRGTEIDKKSLGRIVDYCNGQKIPVKMFFISETVLELILEVFPDSVVSSDRAWSDYLYMSNDLVTLAGRRYAGQRNHINRFERENPSWSFERITGSNVRDAKVFIEKSTRGGEKDSPVFVEGGKKAIEVIDNLELYGQFGGLLYVSGAVTGVSLGETVGDTLFVHTEMADVAYHGAYPALMNSFARCFVTADTLYINREEDDGVEGLRVSKLSYHPAELLDKYTVELK